MLYIPEKFPAINIKYHDDIIAVSFINRINNIY